MNEQSAQPIVWLTPEQAAARAQVGKRTIYRECSARRLKHATIGGRREIRIKPEWVDQWLESASIVEVKA